jgi:hypothetical protein
VTNIGSSAFDGCSGIIEKENGVNYVDKWAVGFDRTVSSVTLRDNTVGIADTAFRMATGLGSIELPSSVEIIGSYAFAYSGITSIEIPSSAINIQFDAFTGCDALDSITVEEGNSKYHSTGNCVIETESRTLVFGLKNCVIPNDDSVTSIGACAFLNSDIESINIPNNITSIGFAAFCNSKIKSIDIPDSVTSIDDYAFQACFYLESVTIGKGVTSIGYNAFNPNPSLKSVIFKNPNGWYLWEDPECTVVVGPVSDYTFANPLITAQNLRSSFCDYYMKRVG